jgi:predicted nucleic acid-binding protein
VILFDTSVLSLVFRRTRPGPKERRVAEAVVELLSGKAPLGLPGIVLQEILSGVRSEKQFAELHRRLLASFDVLLPSVEDFV